MIQKEDIDRLEQVIVKAKEDFSWDSLAHGMSQERYVAEAVLHGFEVRVEYRALIRSPWNILDPKELREQGYTEQWSGYDTDPKAIIKFANYRSEEERRWIAGWQKRLVLVSPWADIPTP